MQALIAEKPVALVSSHPPVYILMLRVQSSHSCLSTQPPHIHVPPDFTSRNERLHLAGLMTFRMLQAMVERGH